MSKDHTVPTLADVAEAARVSTATVSRCLNFPEKVAPATRAKVAKAINELGYAPNFGAKVMAAKRTNTIGAIIPTMENAIFAKGLQAFQEELNRAGYTMLVASTNYQPQVEDSQIRALIARGADALLLIGHARAAEIYALLETQNVPLLVAWAFDADQPRPSVGFDNRRAMAAMAEAVLQEGHRKLACITGPVAGNDRAAERLVGIRAVMHAAGLEPDTLEVVETPYSIDKGAAAMAQLMRKENRPTAVLCGNDVLAVGALRQAQDMGFAVPDDVSVTGFDDIELAQIVRPGLTTVQVPHREMGRAAAQTLVKMLKENPAEIASAKLETRLVIRGTLGPAPKR